MSLLTYLILTANTVSLPSEQAAHASFYMLYEMCVFVRRVPVLTWQYIFISVLLYVLFPLSYVGGVDLLRPVFGG